MCPWRHSPSPSWSQARRCQTAQPTSKPVHHCDWQTTTDIWSNCFVVVVNQSVSVFRGQFGAFLEKIGAQPVRRPFGTPPSRPVHLSHRAEGAVELDVRLVGTGLFLARLYPKLRTHNNGNARRRLKDYKQCRDDDLPLNQAKGRRCPLVAPHMDQSNDIFALSPCFKIELDQVPFISGRNETKKVARRRWAILAKALKVFPLISPDEPLSAHPISVHWLLIDCRVVEPGLLCEGAQRASF
ncbi:hypothetical protein HUJ05_010951 [Dendroctonus ponderosae]|nr:hypothetical protein HUJ05_010951 [Dendroctonus ponderosae]